jgi:hypothetical protein
VHFREAAEEVKNFRIFFTFFFLSFSQRANIDEERIFREMKLYNFFFRLMLPLPLLRPHTISTRHILILVLYSLSLSLLFFLCHLRSFSTHVDVDDDDVLLCCFLSLNARHHAHVCVGTFVCIRKNIRRKKNKN